MKCVSQEHKDKKLDWLSLPNVPHGQPHNAYRENLTEISHRKIIKETEKHYRCQRVVLYILLKREEIERIKSQCGDENKNIPILRDK